MISSSNHKAIRPLRRSTSSALIVLLALTLAAPASAQVMQSGNYQVEFDSVNAGGARSSSANYRLEDTGGEVGTGYSDSLSFTVHAGYQQAEAAAPAPAPAPEPAPEAPGRPDQGTRFYLYDIVVSPGFSGALISWKSSWESRTEVRWGKTGSYEIGALRESSAALSHFASILNLQSGSAYQFELNAEDVFGRLAAYRGSFTTLPMPEEAAFPGVSAFGAFPDGNDVRLTWKNPAHPDYEETRIVRSDSFFPQDPDGGRTVYEGAGEEALDRDLERGKTYYYAAFARSVAGVWSSPAIASVRISEEGAVIIESPFDEFPEALEVHPDIAALTLFDILFLQDGIPVPRTEEGILIDGAKSLLIAIPYERLPEVLKAIGFTLYDPEDPTKTFSFLMKVTRSKDYYIAEIAPLEAGGVYAFALHILDYQNQGLKKLYGNLLVSSAIESSPGEFFSAGSTAGMLFLVFLVLLLVLLMVYVLLSRRVSHSTSSV